MILNNNKEILIKLRIIILIYNNNHSKKMIKKIIEILINKKGQEFARIIGSIDFEDKNFVNWIKKYN